MIYTGKYENIDKNFKRVISVSNKISEKNDFNGKILHDLVLENNSFSKDSKDFNEEEKITLYIENYWKNVLSKLDPDEIYSKLNNNVLASHGNNDELCDRHIIAAWLELFLGEEILEVKIEKNKFIELSKPEYIKPILERVIKENTDMKGFESIEALYKHDIGEKLEKVADTYAKKGDFKVAYKLFQSSSFEKQQAIDIEKREKEMKVKKMLCKN